MDAGCWLCRSKHKEVYVGKSAYCNLEVLWGVNASASSEVHDSTLPRKASSVNLLGACT